MKTKVRKRLLGLVVLLSAVIIAAGGGMADEPFGVVILPFKMNAARDLSFMKQGIVDMLTSRLSWEDRVVVVVREDTDQVLKEVSVPIDEKIARSIGSSLEADYVLFGSLTVFGSSISLDGKVVDVHQKRPTLTFFKQSKEMDDVIPQINLFATEINEKIFGRSVAALKPPPQPAEPPGIYAHPESLLSEGSKDQPKVSREKPAQGVASTGFWKSRSFKIAIKGIALGDVDADGKTEVVFITKRRIYVYRFENKRFLKIKEIAGKRSQRFMGVDVADINGNGRAEIFVTSLKGAGQRLDSFVLESDGDDFRQVSKGAPWYYRVIDAPDQGHMLLGQKRRMDEPFVPGVYRLVWRNSEYQPEERLTSSKRVNVLGVVLGDVMNKGQQVIVAFDKADHIRLFAPSGEELWKSDEPYGGSMNYLEVSVKARGGDTDRFYLPQRIFIRDLDRDGKHEVVVATNQGSVGRFFARFRRFAGGHLVSLSWDGLGLTQTWQTPKVSAYISDYGIGDFDHDGNEEVVVAHVAKQGSAITPASSSIIAYELP